MQEISSILFFSAILTARLTHVTSDNESEDLLGWFLGSETTSSDGTFLNLSHMGIKKIDGVFLKYWNITHLSLEGNSIVLIESGDQLNLSNLIYLNLASNRLDFNMMLNSEISGNIRTSMYDQYGDRRSYYNDPPREQQSPRDCGLKRFYAYFGLPKLTHLYLTGNSIESESFSSLVLLRTLTHLYLDRNGVRSLDGSKLTTVEYLQLDHNDIPYVTAGYSDVDSLISEGLNLTGARKLKFLSVAHNKISLLTSDAFQESKNLTHLDLSYNSIRRIHEGTFDGLVSLRNLSLSYNKIDSFPAGIFKDLSNLYNLQLRKTGLTTVHSDVFEGCAALAFLDLSENKLAVLPDTWMRSLKSIRALNVNRNQFTSVHDLGLDSNSSILTVNMTNNPVKYFTGILSTDLPKTVTIFFDGRKECESESTRCVQC